MNITRIAQLILPENQRSNENSIMTQTRTPTLEHRGYIFLSRSSKNWKSDSKYFTRSMRVACKTDRNTCVLIFPEGSDLSESNLAKTNEWAKKNGFEKKSYTLHPRVKGFRVMLDAAVNEIDSVVYVLHILSFYLHKHHPKTTGMLPWDM